MAGVLSRLFTGVWQQHYAELNVDQKNLCIYNNADKDEEVISYNFDLERTEMMLPQVSASKANDTNIQSICFVVYYGNNIGPTFPALFCPSGIRTRIHAYKTDGQERVYCGHCEVSDKDGGGASGVMA